MSNALFLPILYLSCFGQAYILLFLSCKGNNFAVRCVSSNVIYKGRVGLNLGIKLFSQGDHSSVFATRGFPQTLSFTPVH